MAAPSASIMKNLTIILLLFTTFLVIAFAKSPRIIAKLVHRDSIQSPYYNPHATATANGRAKRELESSIARYAYLLGTNITNKNDYRAGLFPEDTRLIFLANISIGEPPVVQLLNMDTASSLLWFQCLPCTKCHKQSVPIFDPSKSSTYANLSCHSTLCKDVCDSLDNCIYDIGYYDGSSTTGNIAFEKLTFETSDEGISNISSVLVGCGHENDDKDAQRSGVLGLGPDSNISLVFRVGSKFSYCIGSITDPHYAYNNLIIGDGAKIEGNSSPLEFYQGRYFVSLEGISVGLKRLDIDPKIFKRSLDTGNGGVIIDSGATIILLVRAAYEPLRDEVEKALNGSLEHVPDQWGRTHLCRRGIISRDIKGFPPVIFHFAGGAKLVLDENSVFLQDGPNEFCFAVYKSPLDRTTSVIGVRAQQFYNVAYNLVDKTISFLNIDCQLLES